MDQSYFDAPQTIGMIMVVMEGSLLAKTCNIPGPIQKCAGFCGERPPWQKAILYIVFGLPAICLCQSLSILIGSGLVLTTAGIYIKDAIDAKR